MRNERLTALAVTRAKPKRDEAAIRTERPDRMCRGLYCVIQPSGAKSWALRYRHGGRSRKLTLGAVLGADEEAPEPKVGDPLSLAAARRLAAEAMHQVELGRDPAREKADGRSRLALKPVETFQAIAESYLKREGKSLRSADEWRADLERLVFPSIGFIPIAAIRRGDIIRLLDSIEDDRGPVMADKALALVRRIMGWHAARTDDFASPIIRGMARTRPRERARERVLTDDELRSVWTAAESVAGLVPSFASSFDCGTSERSGRVAVGRAIGRRLDPSGATEQGQARAGAAAVRRGAELTGGRSAHGPLRVRRAGRPTNGGILEIQGGI